MFQASPLSLAAAALYLAIAMWLGFTGWKARKRAGTGRDHRFWIIAAIIFLLLATSRILALEDLIRDAIRASLADNALYGTRQQLQLPLAIAAIFSAALIAWAWVKRRHAARANSRKQATLLACAGLAAMALLVMLRMISLHAIDNWLYSGVRLNWWIDIGASLTVAFAAWKYLVAMRQ